MRSFKRVILSIILIIVLYLFFKSIEFENENQISQVYVPAIFAVSFSLALFYPMVRRYLIMLSFCLFAIMFFFYLFNIIDISNGFGSLGFGILMLTILSYLPILLRNGQIDKF